MLRQCELYADFPSVKMLHTAPIEDTRNPLKTETGVRMLNGATAHRTVFHIPFQGVYSFVSLNICFAYRKWHFSKQNLLQNNNSNKNRSNNVDCLNRKTCLCLCQAKTIRASDGNEWMFAFFVIDVCVLCAPCVGLLCQRKTHAPRPTPRQCAAGIPITRSPLTSFRMKFPFSNEYMHGCQLGRVHFSPENAILRAFISRTAIRFIDCTMDCIIGIINLVRFVFEVGVALSTNSFCIALTGSAAYQARFVFSIRPRHSLKLEHEHRKSFAAPDFTRRANPGKVDLSQSKSIICTSFSHQPLDNRVQSAYMASASCSCASCFRNRRIFACFLIL